MPNWISLQTAIKERTIPKAYGAYAIRCCVVRGRPRHINRIWGTDKKGIMYFGETGSKEGLSGRLRAFLIAAKSKAAPHSGGKRYHRLKYKRHPGYGLDNLQVKWVKFESKEDAKKRQDEWLRKYALKFGELPPLNGQGA